MLHIFCYSSGLSKGSPNWFFYRCVYGSPLQGLHRKGVRSSPVSISWIELVSCSAHRRRDTWLGLRSVGCGRRWQGQAAIASSTDCSNNKGWSPFDTGGETAWQRRGHQWINVVVKVSIRFWTSNNYWRWSVVLDIGWRGYRYDSIYVSTWFGGYWGHVVHTCRGFEGIGYLVLGGAEWKTNSLLGWLLLNIYVKYLHNLP